VVSIRRRLALLAFAVSAAMACNAITGTGKYEIVDCPSGSCGDGGPSGDGQSADDDDGAADAAVDTGDVPLPSCPSGRAPLRLTVTGTGGSVEPNSGGLIVTAGSSQDACLSIDTVDLRATANATWTGPSCKDGNAGRDRCVFDLGAAGLKVVAALP
jgi:hypothetical protein